MLQVLSLNCVYRLSLILNFLSINLLKTYEPRKVITSKKTFNPIKIFLPSIYKHEFHIMNNNFNIRQYRLS
jgi:hypothetical protein